MQQTNARRSGTALVAIGAFKLAKATLLITLGIASLYGRRHDLGEVAEHWLGALSGKTASSLVDSLVAWLSIVDEHTLRNLAIGSFVVAGLFLIEGVGLCLRKRWAEFFTIALTASFLPVEIYEITRHASAPRIVVLLVNLLILAYLVIQVRRHEPTETAGG